MALADTDTGELAPYLDAGWDLIPLHRHDHADEYKGRRRSRGKSPLHSNWTRRPYRSRDQVAHMQGGGNVGVRLRPGDLVVDVDPRNFAEGDDPWLRLCGDVSLDPDDFPCVETGSGGLHVYMTKPEDVSIRDSLEGYLGVEFKTVGRQVVAAGSLHPDTGRTYSWDPLRPSLGEVRPAPRLLLNLIRRPSAARATGGGEHTQEELADMLDRLDPEDFREHDKWLQLMQACHHATAGDGRSEFVEWCTRDPEYRDHAALVGRRWDSLHADSEGARVTFRTLHKFLVDTGAGESIPRKSAQDDFEDLDAPDTPTGPDEGEPEHERKGPMERMNDNFWAVMDGGQFRVMWRQVDPSQDPAREHWVRADFHNFDKMLANRRVQRGDSTTPLAKAWLEWSGRRSAEGVVFDPERDHPGFLNLWTGWGVEPHKREGGWSLLHDLLLEALCDGDEDVLGYVLDWSAHMVQHPNSPAEVALCFQGAKGVGKGTFCRALCALAGRHGMQVTSSEQLTGRFNDHLRDMILLFADEAVRPFDRDAESRLKGLITEPVLAFEGKGKDVRTDRNRLHVVMASNEEWFVPMGLDGERRFLVTRVNTSWQGKHDRFSALNRQLRDGGLQALLWDLLERDVSGFQPREHIPTTRAAIDQKVRGMGPLAQWWMGVLEEGELPFDTVLPEGADWTFDRVRVFRQDVRDAYSAFCASIGVRPFSMGRSSEMAFAQELGRLVPGVGDSRAKATAPDDRPDVRRHSDGRAWAYELPTLGECRSRVEDLLGGRVDWGD